MPPAQQRRQIRGDHRPGKEALGRPGADPFSHRQARPDRGERLRTPIGCGVVGPDQEACGSARVRCRREQIIVLPQQGLLELAADEGLDRGPRFAGRIDRVHERPPARIGQP